MAGRTLVVGTSEFGRRVRANANGTDHGTANALFAIGSRVNPGLWGAAPSLTNLDNHGNLIGQVDYRQVYGNLLETWLGADQAEILGQNWGDLGFLRAPDASGSSGGSDPITVSDSGIRAKRAEVARLYLAYFLRRPDEGGLDYWAGLRQRGRRLVTISAEFARSQEFADRYGSLSNTEFVGLVYRNVLQREPDAAGLTHWTAALDRGMPRGLVMLGFSESSEFRNRIEPEVQAIEAAGPIGRLYRAYFLRAPDREGLNYWIDRGLPLDQVSQAFAESTEFRERYGELSDEAFVTTVYRNVLDREPDASGHGHWVRMLRGESRGSVMLGFSNSTEFIDRVATLD